MVLRLMVLRLMVLQKHFQVLLVLFFLSTKSFFLCSTNLITFLFFIENIFIDIIFFIFSHKFIKLRISKSFILNLISTRIPWEPITYLTNKYMEVTIRFVEFTCSKFSFLFRLIYTSYFNTSYKVLKLFLSSNSFCRESSCL